MLALSMPTRLLRLASSLCGLALLTSTWQLAGAQQLEFKNTLMPQPAKLTVADGELTITPDLRLTLNGATNPLLEQAALRLLNRLEAQTAVQLDKNLQSASGVIDV